MEKQQKEKKFFKPNFARKTAKKVNNPNPVQTTTKKATNPALLESIAKLVNNPKLAQKITDVVERPLPKKFINYGPTSAQPKSKAAGRPFFNIFPDTFRENTLRLDVSVFPNNIFCSIKNSRRNKILCKCSAGTYKIKISRKNLKYASKAVINNFFKEIKTRRINFTVPVILAIVAPSTLKKMILVTVLNLLKFIKNKRIMVCIKHKKVFNGCRAKKQIRKKQKRYAVYK